VLAELVDPQSKESTKVDKILMRIDSIQLPQTINTQRYQYYSNLPVQIRNSLIWGSFSSELIVQDISMLLSAREGKIQTEPLHTCKDICIYSNSYLSLSLLKSISLKTNN